ncbi:homoserine dehydrogenase [Aquibacillus albus]|uniref:Homoserine dehydrogenase n=1 Tax=Aquibacillus albus TaxID=1168171 RepID=A0ABS2MYT5_9BACI|nr:homoserine dehydrogenase [Aquibacillus albus]MBM7571054.1 homoserine dehydrogenase [Aquibacillus albus]
MSSLKIVLLGFGTVGEGVYQTIQTHQNRLQSLLGKKVEIVGVLVNDINKKRKIDQHVVITDDMDDLLEIPDVDVVIEAIVGVEPGYSYVKKSLDKGFHVITANKELLANKGKELKKQAVQNHVRLEYEAAVAGGIPIISTLRHLLRVNRITKIEAILNGTSNYILTDITENQTPFKDALYDAQQKGYAEADPSNDIDGWDAFYKLMILSDLLFGTQPSWDSIVHRGIRNVRDVDILAAHSIGCKIKHVASLVSEDGDVKLAVEPVVLPSSHALYSVDGVDNAVMVTGDIVGQLQLQGPGAGALPTASAIIEDLVNIYQIKENVYEESAVSFTSLSESALEDWLVIGLADSIDSLTIQDKWEISKDGSTTTCWRVTASEADVQSVVQDQPGVAYYRMNSQFSEIKSLSTVG